MKLTIFNGSPRGRSSNSDKLISWVIDKPSEDICYLNKLSLHKGYLEKASSAEALLFVFPLYVDSMPGITKLFFELMEINREIFSKKPVYYIIHSGFPEMIQSRALNRYLSYFSEKIIGMDYKGTVIIAGSEAMQVAPDGAFRKLQSHLKLVGNAVQSGKPIPENINIKINKRNRLTSFQLFLFKINPAKNFYWYYRARQHKGKINLLDQPYA